MVNIFEKTKITDQCFNQFFQPIHDIWSQLDSLLYNNLIIELWDIEQDENYYILKFDLRNALTTNEEYIRKI
jgi:hypothetical protein